MFNFIRRLVGRQRSRLFNQRLGFILTFIAGAVNAGGFIAVNRYTSHMTGVVSRIADDFATGAWLLVAGGLLLLLVFIFGAMTATILINWARRQKMASEYALCLLFEASLLLTFGVLGGFLALHTTVLFSATVGLLTYIAGVQNALGTTISKAEIKTTHMTGVITDLGIELGRAVYWNSTKNPLKPELHIKADSQKLKFLSRSLGAFIFGGVIGAWMFQIMSYKATIPLAMVLSSLALVPIYDDWRIRQRRQQRLHQKKSI
jgi:uncharacterized membrane protein YoaK (UPF0700 family)